MSDLLLDTHTLVWYLAGSPRLSNAGKAAIGIAIDAGDRLLISPISLAEILFLEEKSKLPAGTLQRVTEEMQKPASSLAEAPVVSGVVQCMASISRSTVPEMPDRLIAATSLFFGVPLVTADHRIRQAIANTIW